MNRLTRLTAILTQLQSKRTVKAQDIAKKFNISLRTVYRDIKTLEDAGVPILGETGIGYSIMEGYRLPPVMFTDKEANALITAEKFIQKNKDASLIKHFEDVVSKVKAVLRYETKEKTSLLSERISLFINLNKKTSSDHLTEIQTAITDYKALKITYHAQYNDTTTVRKIEPLAVYYTQENWILIAHCQMRNELREFRLDRIKELLLLDETFKKHDFNFRDYFENMC